MDLKPQEQNGGKPPSHYPKSRTSMAAALSTPSMWTRLHLSGQLMARGYAHLSYRSSSLL